MDMVSGAKRRRVAKKEEEHHEDHISGLPDAVLCEIVSLRSRTEDARRPFRDHLWRAAPLNLDLHDRPPTQYQCPNLDLDDEDDDDDDVPPIQRRIPLARISGILTSHPGPGRRFCVPEHYLEHDAHCTARVDAWLRSPTLDCLQELDFHYGSATSLRGIPPLPELARRFSSASYAPEPYERPNFRDLSYCPARRLPSPAELDDD